MQKRYKVLCIFLIALSIGVSGQNYSNNPYTRFAIGDLMNDGFAYNSSLGGSSFGLRPSNQVNYLNPASYTAQDTLSFLFHAGLNGRMSYLSTSQEKDRPMHPLTISDPLSAGSAAPPSGLLPYGIYVPLVAR